MFANFTTVRDSVIADCEKYVILRRAHKADIYKTTEHYIAANNIIVSMQLRYIAYEILRPYIYDLYTHECIRHAHKLANELAQYSNYVQVSTTIPHKLITVSVDCVIIATFRNLPHVDVDNSVAFSLVSCKFPYADVLAFSAEVELTEIYHRMYSITSVDDWPKLIAVEKTLCGDIPQADGGAMKRRKAKHDNYNQAIIDQLYTVLAPFTIFIGTSAMHILHNKPHTRVQCIATVGITKILNIVKKTMGAKCILKNSTVTIPYDCRIKRLLILAGKHIIGEVYNCAKYELTPVIHHNGKIVGTRFVLLRFAYIELFLLRLLTAIGALPEHSAEQLRANVLRQIVRFRECGGDFSTEYIGRHIDFRIYCRKIQQANRIHRYEPAVYKHQHGKYNGV